MIGIGRTISIDPVRCPHVDGSSLSLNDHEVVLTFDDGPAPPCTNIVLDTLRAEGVKATFFFVGYRAANLPELVKDADRECHTIATHTQTHRDLSAASPVEGAVEINDGISSVTGALGKPPAPFFRFPFFATSSRMEAHLVSLGVAAWKADVETDDWTGISVDQLIEQALDRLERRGGGVLMLHDIHPVTALALPTLISELKHRKYRIVHVVPKGRYQTE
jgi:peptidoglycan/xylan/chitin deacetylase (PgdA/CDA1 family)